MTLKDILEMIVADRGPISLLFIVAMTILQIAPININPWSALFRWFGKQLNQDVIKDIDEVKEQLNQHIKDSEESELKARRTTILDFGSSVIRGVNYHKEKFDFMINECDAYQEYCRRNNIQNGVAEASIAEIRRIYQDHLRNDDFLVDRVPQGTSNS